MFLAHSSPNSTGTRTEFTQSIDLDVTDFYRRVRDNLPPDPERHDLHDMSSPTHGVEIRKRPICCAEVAQVVRGDLVYLEATLFRLEAFGVARGLPGLGEMW